MGNGDWGLGSLKNFWYEQQTKLNVDSVSIYAIFSWKNDLYENMQVSDEEGREFENL